MKAFDTTQRTTVHDSSYIRVLKVLDRVLHMVSEPTAILAGMGCAAAVLIVMFETVNRYGKLSTLTIAEEYTGYLLVFIATFGAASSFRSSLFPRLDFVVKRLNRKAQELLAMLGWILGLLVNGVYLWSSWELFKESYRLKATSWTTLYTPLAIPQGYMVVGFALFELVLLGTAIKAALEIMNTKRI